MNKINMSRGRRGDACGGGVHQFYARHCIIITAGIISRDHVPGHLLLPPRRGDACGGGVHQFYARH